MDVVRDGTDVLLVAVGAMVRTALEAAELAAQSGVSVTVVDPLWVKPVDEALSALAARHHLVVTVEDGGRVGGVGAAIAQRLADDKVGLPVVTLGLAQEFIDQGRRDAILAAQGLSAPELARRVVDAVTAVHPALIGTRH